MLPLNIYIYTLGLDFMYLWDNHPPRGSCTEFVAFHCFSYPRPGWLWEGAVILIQACSLFSPMWVCIECDMGNPLGDQTLTLHTRNGGGTICPLASETCYQIDIGLCLRFRAGVLSREPDSPDLSPQWSPCYQGLTH